MSGHTVTVHLTEPQLDALLSAAIAMLAGDEGEGDAIDVSFAVLERAAQKLGQASHRGGR